MKMVSSLEKCFYNDTLDSEPEKEAFLYIPDITVGRGNPCD